jgi:hypothetical protein
MNFTEKCHDLINVLKRLLWLLCRVDLGRWVWVLTAFRKEWLALWAWILDIKRSGRFHSILRYKILVNV